MPQIRLEATPSSLIWGSLLLLLFLLLLLLLIILYFLYFILFFKLKGKTIQKKRIITVLLDNRLYGRALGSPV